MKHRIAAIRLIVLLVAGALPAQAGDIEDCRIGKAATKSNVARVFAACDRLAGQGNAEAQFLLANMYRNGRGVPQDDAAAVEWYLKAADQNYARAQYNLGVMYGKGKGVPADYVQSYKWFAVAAVRHPPGASRDQAAAARDFVAKVMDPDQVAKAKQLARDWLAAHPSEPAAQ